MLRFYPQCSRQFRRRHDNRSHIEQMMSQLLEGGLIGYLETLFDISLQNIAYQILHIIMVFADNEQFRKSSLFQIMIKGCSPERLYLGSHSFRIHLFHQTILIKGEWKQRYLLAAPREMSSQVAAQKYGIRTCYNDMHPPAKHAIHEKVPALDILYLVKKQIIEITIYLIQYFQNIVQIFCLYVSQPLIVKIYISVFHTCFLQCLEA